MVDLSSLRGKSKAELISFRNSILDELDEWGFMIDDIDKIQIYNTVANINKLIEEAE